MRAVIVYLIIGLLLAIGLAVGSSADAASQATEVEVAEFFVAMQVGLVMVGYDPGTIDGEFGPRTLAALTAYAKGAGIVLNRATLPLVLRLLDAEAAEALRTSGDREDEGRQEAAGTVQNMPFKQW